MPRSRPAFFDCASRALKSGPIGKLLRARKMRGEIAGIVVLAGRRPVRHRARLDEIAPPQRIGRDPDFARGNVDQPLDDISRLGTAGAAIGVDRNGVGVDAAHADMAGRDIVDARRQPGAEIRNVRRELRQVGAHVGDEIDVEREEAMLAVERQPRRRKVVAALRIAEEMLGAIRDPRHRLAQAHGGDGGERIFAIAEQLGAEAAADIGRHHAQLPLRHMENVGQHVADGVRALARQGQRQAVVRRIVFGDDAAGVEVIGRQALIDQRQRHDFRRLREGARGRRLVAERDVEGDIAAVLRPNPRRVRLQRRGDADDMRPRLPIDRDRLGGVLGAIKRIGDHKGNRVADVAHLVARQDRIGRHIDRGVRKRHSARQRPEIGGVGASEHEPHARHRPRFRRIDAKTRMGVRRAQHHRVQRAAHRSIGDIAAAPAQQRVVLLAHDRLADAELQRLHGDYSALVRSEASASFEQTFGGVAPRPQWATGR